MYVVLLIFIPNSNVQMVIIVYRVCMVIELTSPSPRLLKEEKGEASRRRGSSKEERGGGHIEWSGHCALGKMEGWKRNESDFLTSSQILGLP